MAVKRPTLYKKIDASYDYDTGTYTGVSMQVIIDADRIDENWINELKIIPRSIGRSSHGSKEMETMINNMKRLTRTFRIHGSITNTNTSGTHTAVAESSTVLTDSTKDFQALGIAIGMTILNTTDSSSGTITAVTATTITVGSLTGGSDNKFQQNDAYSISQTAHVKANLLRRMLWDGNAGSQATLSIPGTDGEQPPSQNLSGFVKGLNVTINKSMTITELKALNPNAGVIDVTVDFITGTQM